MSFEKPRPQPRRSGVEFEEDRAWVSFYRRVRADVAIATEVQAQLEADPESKRTHLALDLRCKESLRMHKVRNARNKRIGQFVRWRCHGAFIVPLQGLRRGLRLGGDIAVEGLPEPGKEPTVPQVRRLASDPEFANAAAGFVQPVAPSTAAPAAAEASALPSRALKPKVARTAARSASPLAGDTPRSPRCPDRRTLAPTALEVREAFAPIPHLPCEARCRLRCLPAAPPRTLPHPSPSICPLRRLASPMKGLPMATAATATTAATTAATAADTLRAIETRVKRAIVQQLRLMVQEILGMRTHLALEDRAHADLLLMKLGHQERAQTIAPDDPSPMPIYLMPTLTLGLSEPSMPNSMAEPALLLSRGSTRYSPARGYDRIAPFGWHCHADILWRPGHPTQTRVCGSRTQSLKLSFEYRIGTSLLLFTRVVARCPRILETHVGITSKRETFFLAVEPVLPEPAL